ncbi:hypothetical protein PSCICJ_21940 [Pseudomonas cichorii]|nr:hypothetical protein PSCICJ_21940 [Pseudomonas cichorii]
MLDGEGPLKATPFYYQLDHLGTPQELTDYSGEILWSAKYRAYGNLAALDIAEIDNPLRFQGQYFDAETGLHYNRHRYYNPGTGRFLTPDPIKLAGGLNNYRYVPNPTGWVDPLGLTGECPAATRSSTPEVVDPADNAHVNQGEPTVPLPSGIGGTGANYDKVNGQGLYVLKNEAGDVMYVGRGDAPARIDKHAITPGKDDLIAQTLWENNLTKAQAKGLEQRIMDLYGGARRQNPDTPLLNEYRSYAPENPNAQLYRDAGTDQLFNETLKRIGQ